MEGDGDAAPERGAALTDAAGEVEIRAFWDAVAADWEIQVGDEGDANRRLNSDPVLWRFLGDVRGRRVLDAGCGTGYLTRKLHERGAGTVGVDLSPEMIGIARARSSPEIDFRVDSVTSLATVPDSSFDRVVANYVLMDTPDFGAAVASFHRVLGAGGAAVVVFSHPCFPQGRRTEDDGGAVAHYVWDFPYFESSRQVDPPWKHFTSEFIWFHRPLSDYWKAFRKAGFAVDDFEEPRLSPELAAIAESEGERRKSSTRPYSVAFKLRKE